MADKFGLEVPPYTGEAFSLEELMKDKCTVWDALVAENGLSPTKLEDVGNWLFVDKMLSLPYPCVYSMKKSKELGFFGFRNTETSLLYWVDKLREKKIIP